MDKHSIKAKRRARELALQALYQWLMAAADLYEIEAQFRMIHDMSKVDADYFCRLLHSIPAQLEILEAQLTPFLDREIQSLNPIELTLLRIGSFELIYCPELPYKVVLDAAISLGKEFGSQDGYRYVNGVLHNLAQKVRSIEISAANE